jgi:hypothetical protein
MGVRRKVGATAAPGLLEFFRLSWLTSVQVLQAVVEGRTLPKLDQVSGTARQQDYGLLIQFQGKYPPDLFAKANQQTIEGHWRKKISTLPAYEWLAGQLSFDVALDKASIVDGDTLRHVCFVHVVAMAMAAYHIERDGSTGFPKVDKRKLGSALSTSKKLRRMASGLRDLDRHTELLEALSTFEALLSTYLLERTRRDRTHPDRVFLKSLRQGFKNYFNDPMATVVEELRAMVVVLDTTRAIVD